MAVKGTISYRFTKVTAQMAAAVIVVGVTFFYVAQPEIRWFIPGAIVAFIGEALRIWAAGHLRKNKMLTTTGPYAYVKNPLYLGTFLITLGAGAMAKNVLIILAGFVWMFIYYVPYKKKQENRKLSNNFGDAWVEYDKAVPAYFPRRRPYAGHGSNGWSFDVLKENSEHETAVSVFLGFMVLLYMLVR